MRDLVRKPNSTKSIEHCWGELETNNIIGCSQSTGNGLDHLINEAYTTIVGHFPLDCGRFWNVFRNVKCNNANNCRCDAQMKNHSVNRSIDSTHSCYDTRLIPYIDLHRLYNVSCHLTLKSSQKSTPNERSF